MWVASGDIACLSLDDVRMEHFKWSVEVYFSCSESK